MVISGVPTMRSTSSLPVLPGVMPAKLCPLSVHQDWLWPWVAKPVRKAAEAAKASTTDLLMVGSVKNTQSRANPTPVQVSPDCANIFETRLFQRSDSYEDLVPPARDARARLPRRRSRAGLPESR